VAAPAPPVEARSAIDPVCGMTVAASEATVHLDVPGGERVYFCGTGCRNAYAALEAKAD
jgi:xanthine dehydrogenase accessory factor